jgi:uncharacterized protein YbdZ (MbtH family)
MSIGIPDQRSPIMSENSVTVELATDPAEMERTQAYERARASDRRLKPNLDYLNARWDELRPRECGRYVAVAGQELFVADTYQEALDMARAAHPDDDGYWVQCVTPMKENHLTFDIETDPERLAQIHARSQRARCNSDWLQAHWCDLLPRARGRYVAVAGQEAFIADTHDEAWSMAKAAHPDDDGALSQYVPYARGPRIYAHRRGVAPR